MIDTSKLYRAATHVYLATENSVADDLSAMLKDAAAEIERLRAALATVDEYFTAAEPLSRSDLRIRETVRAALTADQRGGRLTMGSKKEPGQFDCYGNALPDEPMFILLARDPNAPALVRSWAYEREHQIGRGNRPETDRAVVAEARQCADAMEQWRKTNDGAWRR